jgi:hypothetical protein
VVVSILAGIVGFIAFVGLLCLLIWPDLLGAVVGIWLGKRSRHKAQQRRAAGEAQRGPLTRTYEVDD